MSIINFSTARSSTTKSLHVIALATGFALAGAALSAVACGFCIEDKVAAVYDSAVVERAVADHRHVAFFAIEGDAQVDAATRRAVSSALESAGGVRGTARVALQNGACSIAFDPKRTDVQRIAASADRSLSARKLSLTALRIIDDGGKLKEVAP